MSSIDFDEVLVHVGEKGRYQNIMYYLLCIPASLPAAFVAFSQVFVSATPDHWCRIPEFENLTSLISLEERKALSLPYTMKNGRRVYARCFMYDVNYKAILDSWISKAALSGAALSNHGPRSSSVLTTSQSFVFDATAGLQNSGRFSEPPVSSPDWPTSKCRYGWEYDKRDYDSTLVTELDLVCDNGWLPSTSTTCFYIGSLVGNIVFGWIADKWGRRTAFFAILFLEVIFSIATSFSPDYAVYTALRTVNGFFFPAIYQIPFILALELMGPRHRTFAGMVISMFFATAMCLLALLGYILRNWYTLSLATSVPFVLLFSYWWIIPESPRWLLSKNRIDEAEVIIQHMARVNGRRVPTNFLRKMEMGILKKPGIACNGRSSSDISVDLETEDRPPPPSATPMDLFRNPNIRKKFLILAFDWVANAVVYNGLSYNTTNLGVSDYLAFFIGGIVEIPSYVITWYAMDRIGRRWVLCLTMLLGGVACVSCMFVPEDAVWVTVSLAMIGKFGIAASFAVFYVFVGELLPTVLRSQAMGFASFVAGLGLLTFPSIVHLAVYSTVLPLIVMGSLSVAGALASVFLPETLNIHLPQTIEEGEEFGADFKLWSCPTRPTEARRRQKRESLALRYLFNGRQGDELTTAGVAIVESTSQERLQQHQQQSQDLNTAKMCPLVSLNEDDESDNLSSPQDKECEFSSALHRVE